MRKEKMRFHWFYHHKERKCDNCGEKLGRGDGRYVDRRERRYYCRGCADLITIGFEYASEKVEEERVKMK